MSSLAIFAPSLFDFLEENSSLNFGFFTGFWFAASNAIFRKKSRDAISYDFHELVKPYVRPEFARDMKEALSHLEAKIEDPIGQQELIKKKDERFREFEKLYREERPKSLDR